MFTGIVSELGTVTATTATSGGRSVTIEAPATSRELGVGDSVAVNGVCLTAVAVQAGSRFTVEVVGETMARSNLSELATGHVVDLERPTPAAGRFDGHVVQGHVDGIGELVSRSAEGTAERIRIRLPQELSRYVVEKGSITVDGVSLTVTAVSPADADAAWFEVVLIPHTLRATVLGRRDVGERVNLEVDVIAKYVERILEARR